MKIDWEKMGGLLPAVVQETASGEVLMLAYMNEEALNLSLKTGFAHYFSRTKNRIWKKGEESGNTQAINEIFLDCDNDTILLKVVQNGGAACHTGAKSCFFRKISGEELNLAVANEQNLTQRQNPNAPQTRTKKPAYGIIDEIYHVIMERKLNADPQTSYVANLFKKGENAILKKVGEEATELVMACKDASAQKNKISIVAYSDLAQIDEDMKKMREKEARDEANLYGCNEASEAKRSDPQGSNLQNLSANGSEQKTAANLSAPNKARTEQNLNDKNSQPNLSDDNNSQNARKKLPESNVAPVDLSKIPQSQIERIKDEISRGLFPDEYRSLSQQEADIVYEAADLCFHSLIALAAHGIHPDRVKAELARRFGLSGIEEKNSRKG